MKLGPDQIKSEIECNNVKAICVDTSIFDQKQRGLEWGVLRKLGQFKGSSITLLIPEIVQRELSNHLLRDAEEAERSFDKSLKLMSTAWRVSEQDREEILRLAKKNICAQDIAGERLLTFLNKSGAVMLDTAAHVSMDELLNRYFEERPPFGLKKEKKHEFPDALAVLSLENWASLQDTQVLIVTSDNDWKSYCDESPRLFAVDDLAVALSYFQREEAGYYCRDLAASLREGDPHGVLNAVVSAIRSREDTVELSIDSDSQFSCEESGAEIRFRNIQIQTISGVPDLEAVDYDGKTLTVSLIAEISAEIEVHFSFEKWDGIDREYIPMGSGMATSNEDLTAEVLVTLSGKFPTEFVVDEVEIGTIGAHLEFSDLEPDWMSDSGSFE
jgi:hypothetical protein